MSKTKEKLMIIDGNALIHRSFHALPPSMTTKAGEVVNAVYGFTSFLLKAIKEIRPEYLVLTLDRKGPTFRHEEYKEYKATRVKAPDELYSQIPRVMQVAEAFDIPIFAIEGFEADDLIGTIACKVDGAIDKIIVTGDMDTMQLVNPHTKVYTMSRGLMDSVVYDEKAVEEKYTLKTSQMIDYKALRGDPSDNIPGVKGIGEKTATDLLHEFKTLDGVYKNIESDKIKDRIRELLKTHKDDAYMSKSLATIKCDVPLEFDLEKSRFHKFDTNKVTELFSELEFKSLLPRIKDIVFDNDVSKVVVDKFERDRSQFKYELIDDEVKFEKLLKKLEKQKSFVFDTETTGLDPITAELLGVSFAWEEGVAYYVACRGDARIAPASEVKPEAANLFNYNKEIIPPTPFIKGEPQPHPSPLLRKERGHADVAIHPWLEKLLAIFEDEKIKKAGHNMKFDIRVLRNNGIEVRGAEFDTMIASYLLNPGSRQHGLDGLTFSELGFEKISKVDLLGEGKNKIEFGKVETEKMAVYSCEDADFTHRLVNKLSTHLDEKNLRGLFDKIEIPLVSVLADMEERGIKVDKDFLNKLGKEVGKDIKNLQTKIWKIAGEEFNINSTQQLKVILFDKLEISTDGIGKTKTGFSTSADELEKMKDHHEIIPLIQEYRELAKLANTYIGTLPELINPKTGRVHTCYSQTVAATGRLSSNDPNLQNIPIRTELGREIRKAFVSEPGFKLVSLDYSQIELRLAAHLSGDKRMIKTFQEGIDIHTATAAEINQVKLEEVTKEMRRDAKATNFGVLYGQGPHGLSQTAGIPYASAKDFIDKYFTVYSGVREYIDKTIEEAHTNGYVETLSGRKRYLPDINSSVAMVKKAAERMAVNTPIQGTGADMIKLAMIEVNKRIANELLTNSHESLIKTNKHEEGIPLSRGVRGVSAHEVRMLLTVHDELLFEIKEDMIEEVVPQLKEIMENVMKLDVPIVVEAKVGDCWGEMTKI